MDPNAVTLKIARLNAREKQRQDLVDIFKNMLADPLVLGLAALAGNELAYKAGFYDPRGPKMTPLPPGYAGPPRFDSSQNEVAQSALGGPVWFTIGESLPVSQQKRNFINAMIVGVTTARSLSPYAPAMLAGGKDLGSILKMAAGV